MDTITKNETDEAKEKLNENIPDSLRLKWTLKQLGKQLSYIDELEDTVRDLKRENRKLIEMTKEERKELKKEAFYKLKNHEIAILHDKVKRFRDDYERLLSKINSQHT